MAKTKILPLLCVLFTAAMILSSCVMNYRDEISAITGLDVSAKATVTYTNNHGGFLGDGATAVTMTFFDDELEEQIRENERWKKLPMSVNVAVALYGGTASSGAEWSSVVKDLSDFEMPEISNGYWFFRDRHTQKTDEYDDSDIFSRASFNFVIAVYDADTNTLYYFKIDT